MTREKLRKTYYMPRTCATFVPEGGGGYRV